MDLLSLTTDGHFMARSKYFFYIKHLSLTFTLCCSAVSTSPSLSFNSTITHCFNSHTDWVTSMCDLNRTQTSKNFLESAHFIYHIKYLDKIIQIWVSPQSVLAEVAGHGEASAASAGKTSPQKESRSVVLQNTRISTGKTNSVDISFVPKTVGPIHSKKPIQKYLFS